MPAEVTAGEIFRLSKVGYEAYRSAVVPSCQGEAWEQLGITQKLQWAAAVEAMLNVEPVALHQQRSTK